MRILHIVFSTNRIKYLTKTLKSWENLYTYGHTVDRILFDDMPTGRNDNIFKFLERMHEFRGWYNPVNCGLSVQWTKVWNWIRDSNNNYDYILHQEDDVVLNEPNHISDLINILESDTNMQSLVLQRQPWYFHEQPSKAEYDDLVFPGYRVSKNISTFPIIYSLYRMNMLYHPFTQFYGFNLNEGMIMNYLCLKDQNRYVGMLKGADGSHLITHIGEESIGPRILPGEPNYENFAHIDTTKPYSSRDGVAIP